MSGSATTAPTDIWLEHVNMYGWHQYYLWVDGEVYTNFKGTPRYTWAQEKDIVELYREALTYWSD